MPTERIIIEVTDRGARVVKRNLEDIGSSATKSTSGVNQLNRALAAIGVTISAVAIQRMVDTYTNLQNRLRLVTTGTEQLNAVTKELFNVANSTRVSYEATAEIFARTALATKELGLSQRDTLEFTKSLNQAVVLSGASAQEANAAMIQLSQGLASGTLRGDELRSVLEQLPKVADVIAQGLGVTRGELRQLGQDGKITAADVITSFQKAKDVLNKDFATTIPTISQAFTVLQNKFLEWLGQVNEATGASRTFADLILRLANNVDLLAKALLVAVSAWGAYKIAANAALIASVTTAIVSNVVAFAQLAVQVRSVSQAFALLNAVLLVNPIVLIATIIVGAIAAFILFRKEIIDTAKNIEFFGTNAYEVFLALVDGVTGLFNGMWNAIKGIFDRIKVALVSLAEAIEKVTGVQVIDTKALLGDDPETTFRRAGQSIGENFMEGWKEAIDNGYLSEEIKNKLNPQAQIEQTQVDAGLDIRGANTAITQAQTEAMERQKELLEEIRGPQEDFNFAVSDLNQLYADGLINLQEYNNELANQTENFVRSFEATTFADGFIQQLQLMQLETRNATAKMGQDFAKIFGPGGTLSKGIGDAVGQAIAFGESFTKSIRQIAQTILSQLISALVQIGVNMLINSVIGETIMATTTAASAAAGAATAAAWAPAAAAVSLASFGANAAPASAGIASTYALSAALSKIGGGLPGFEDGGYTGNVGRKQVAGMVHGQEFVVNAAATAKNRAALEAMNRGDSINQSSSQGVQVNIINEIPDAEYTATQMSDNRVELIARRIVREEAPGVIATDIRDPNSRTSKAFSKNTQTQRRRN